MIRRIGLVSLLLAAINLSGCAGLGNMKEIQFQKAPDENKATVNFVRRAVFMADGANSEVWDSDNFIGTLAAGELLQYQAEPGHHLFMVDLQNKWAVAEGELEAGKTYYLKVNLTGWSIILGAADATDPRIEEWNTMTTVTMDEANPKPVPPKYIEGAQRIIKRVENGNANVTRITERNAL